MRVLTGHNFLQGGHTLAGHGLSSAGGALAAYAVAGVLPSYVMDTENGIYYDGIYYDGPNQLHDHATTSNRTVVDSDGLIKWAPHNIALNSASPATQSITVVSGADYTVAVRGSGSMTLSNAGTGTATDGSPVEITASTTTLTITLTGSLDKVWVYRSDLGGMQSTGNATDPTYVPTSGSAVYWMGTDHDPVTGEVLGVQGEPAATNLNIHSNTLSNAWWTKSNTTIGTASGLGDLGFGLNKVVENTATSEHYIINNSVSVSNATVYTYSFFVLTSERTRTRHYSFGFNNLTLILDHTTQTVVYTAGGTSPSIRFYDFGGGIVRCAITDTTTSTALNMTTGLVQSGTTFNYTGDGSSGLHVGGYQLEVGSRVTSYIPTNGASATRAAPVVSKPLSEISASLDEIVAVMEFECSDVAADAVIAALDNAGTDLIHYRAHTSQANLLVQDGGVTQADIDAGAISANTQHRVSFKAAANDFLASVDGATAVADTSGTMPTPTTLRLFNSSGGAPLTGIRIKKLILYTA